MSTSTLEQPATATRGPSRHERDLHGVWQPCATSLMLVVLTAVTGIRGADYPAHLLRAILWDEAGAAIWNLRWYGGHPTAPYGVLAPPLVSLLGPFVVVAAATVAATFCFSRLTVDLIPSATTVPANHLFAVVVVTDVVVGRVAFGLGLAIALAALVAWSRGLEVVAVGSAALSSLASPVAGVFLALAATAVIADGQRRRSHAPGTGGWIVAAALAPIVIAAAAFHGTGRFPFRGGHLAVSLIVLLVSARLSRSPVVRVGSLLAAAASMVVFVVPNPLGGNMVRLTQIVAVPLVVIALGAAGRRAIVPGAVVAVAAAGWSVSPGVVAAADWLGDPSSDLRYHEPLIEQVAARNADGRPVGRVEIPFTVNHWESYYVAAAVPYARGWERQTDVVRNPELYEDDLDVGSYRRWLHDNAVRWVAVPDVPIDDDGGGRWERELLTARPGTVPWVRQVWEGSHWRLYEVVDYVAIVQPPAELVSQGVDRFVIRVDRAVTVTIRYAYTDRLSISGGGCVTGTRDGWVEAHLPRPGEYELVVAWVGGDHDCA